MKAYGQMCSSTHNRHPRDHRLEERLWVQEWKPHARAPFLPKYDSNPGSLTRDTCPCGTDVSNDLRQNGNIFWIRTSVRESFLCSEVALDEEDTARWRLSILVRYNIYAFAGKKRSYIHKSSTPMNVWILPWMRCRVVPATITIMPCDIQMASKKWGHDNRLHKCIE